MKLLGSTESKITKNENSENVPNFEITEEVSLPCNIVNNDYQKIQVYYILLFLINRLVNCLIFHLQILYI